MGCILQKFPFIRYVSLECNHHINFFKKLIPHFMKVGGSACLLQNGMDDSPICGNEFPGNFFHPNPETADMLSTLKLNFGP